MISDHLQESDRRECTRLKITLHKCGFYDYQSQTLENLDKKWRKMLTLDRPG